MVHACEGFEGHESMVTNGAIKIETTGTGRERRGTDTARSGVSRELHPAATALGNHPDAAHEQERLLGYKLSTR